MSLDPASVGSAPMFREIRGTGERRYALRSISVLTYATVAVVGLNAASDLWHLMTLVGQSQLLGRIGGHGFSSRPVMVAAARASDVLVNSARLSTLVTLLLSYVIAGFWIYNAACNVRALGARGLEITPGWAVGWYAVPIASLAQPYRAMSEIYRASVSPIGWRKVSTPPLLWFWWGAWLLDNLLGSLSTAISRPLMTLPELVGITDLRIADAAFGVAAATLFAIIVWRVFEAQRNSKSHIGQVAEVFA